MLRVFLISLVTCLSPLISQAQTIRDAFKAMPDSLTPYLSVNNRLDMMDFMDAKMKAVVTNELDGESEMLSLSDDSLSIKMNEALLIEMRMERVVLLDCREDLIECNASDTLLCVRHTYSTKDGGKQIVLRRYDIHSWTIVSSQVEESTLFRRDEELIKKDSF